MWLRSQLQCLLRATLEAPGAPGLSSAAARLSELLGSCLELDAEAPAYPLPDWAVVTEEAGEEEEAGGGGSGEERGEAARGGAAGGEAAGAGAAESEEQDAAGAEGG
jgi:hypothetical protein